MNLLLRTGAIVAGVAIVIVTLVSAARTFILPRAAAIPLTRAISLPVRRIFHWRARARRSFEGMDKAMAGLPTTTVLVLAGAWMFLVFLGYSLIFWGVEGESYSAAVRESGSSLLTLGFAVPRTGIATLIAFTEATIGLGLVAMLIAYLPVLYSSFSDREKAVAIASVRAGTPPCGAEMLWRHREIGEWDRLDEVWRSWEVWFAGIEESHTTFAALPFFRSPEPSRSWITAAGAVLDAASLRASVVDDERDPEAELCIRAGYMALRAIGAVFHLPFDPDPKPTDPISVSRAEFDEACETLASGGVPLKADRDQAWRDFAGWRVNYDLVLIAICGIVMAPPAPWSSDRSSPVFPPLIRTKRAHERAVQWFKSPLDRD